MAFRQRTFRAKKAPGSDDADTDAATAPAAASAAPAAARPPKSMSKTSLLSFDDDAEEEDGPMAMAGKKKEKDPKNKSRTVKPSKFGRAQGLPDLPPSAAVSQRSSAGEYSGDRLKELQGNALRFDSKLLGNGDGGSVPLPLESSIIKLSGSFKAKLGSDDRFQIDSHGLVKPAAPKPPLEVAMALPPPAHPRASSQAGTASAGTAGQLPPPSSAAREDGSDDDSDGIPDQKIIKLAKAKRERLRQAHIAPDYIPLGGAAKLVGDYKEARATAKSQSRAQVEDGEEEMGGGEGGMRDKCEDDQSDDELEEHMRIKFGNEKGGQKTGRDGYARSLNAQKHNDEDEDFAEEQLRRAVRSQGQSTAAANYQQAHGSWLGTGGGSDNGHAMGGGGYGGEPGTGAGAYGGHSNAAMGGAGAAGGGGFGARLAGGGTAGNTRMELIASAGASSLASLQEGLRRMQASSKSCQANLVRTTDNLAASLAKIETIETEAKATSEKYVFIQKTKAYIADLCDCLADKSLIVEELEDSLMDLREDRAAAGKDYIGSLEDELLMLAGVGVNAAMAVMSRSGAATAAGIAGERAIEDAEDDLLETSSAVELDEFGRNVNLQQKREAEERAKKRQALIKSEREILAELAKGGLVGLPVEDVAAGEVGGEETSETKRYESRHQEIMETAATVFVDADEEYASLDAVKTALEELKFSYPKQYTSMYMHLSTPALFASYVRLELLHWDPLYADSASHGALETSREGVHKGFDQQAWYESLFDFGGGPDPAAIAPDDPDNELVPQLVRKLVLPLAQHMLERCWDPSNMRSSRAAAALCGDLCVYVPAEEERMKDLLDGVAASLGRAVAACNVPSWPPAITVLVPMAEAVQLRRFRQAVRVLHAISAFEGLLSRSLLLPLALSQLVALHLLPFMRSASRDVNMAVVRLETVVAALPGDWFVAGAPTEAAALCEHTSTLCRALEIARHERDRAPVAARLAEVAKKVGETERAARLVSVFALRM